MHTETIQTTQPIAVRATVSYPAVSAPGLDAWAVYVATAYGGQLRRQGLGTGSRNLEFEFPKVDRIGAFIAAIESNPGCSVQIGKAEGDL